MSEEPVDARELDHGTVLETQVGTYVVIGVQRVEDQDGNVKQFNYIITKPENLVAEEETTDETESDN